MGKNKPKIEQKVSCFAERGRYNGFWVQEEVNMGAMKRLWASGAADMVGKVPSATVEEQGTGTYLVVDDGRKYAVGCDLAGRLFCGWCSGERNQADTSGELHVVTDCEHVRLVRAHLQERP